MEEEKTPNVEEAHFVAGGEVALAADPAEAIATTSIPRGRGYAIKRPGNIAWAAENGNYPGCRLIRVTPTGVWGVDAAADLAVRTAVGCGDGLEPVPYVNEFFRQHGGLLVVNMQVDEMGITLLYTNQLEGEELEEFQEASSALAEHMEKWRAKREEEKAAALALKAQHEAEYDALVALGKKVRAHNILSRFKELEAELAQVKAELKAAKKRAAK